MFQDSAPLIYDSGNYLPALEQAAEIIGYDQFVREEQPKLRAQGRRVGMGVTCYVEGTGIGPYEGARVTVEPSGKIRCATGVGTQGQGHFTVFAQLVADVLGVDVEDVRVVTGDTREFHWGTGTFASRGAVVAGSACHAAATAVREKVLKLASSLLNVPSDRLELAGGRRIVVFRWVSCPERPIHCGEPSDLARSPGSKARRTSAPIAAARRAACTP
jgi:CO/xanthine dehydrogenase Mo-binding subunit